ncbi:hypothetical protein B0A48_16764 [Cryoendolithus antarcticus]|uniref:Uncharacterized protein n=1 Tax=Cryoendolithus antarcticus TaxID=1507870 RepID=A0A1V8SDI9_9PEZI|nr:hypothetical protein B0A48_16764 [Cryoendolithus antarcticus]
MLRPFGNVTVLPPAQWHAEPQSRGTFNILSNCLITMLLCIWTSVHLNLPEHRKEHAQAYRKLSWMLIGLLVPEFVVWNAWEQRKRVKQLSALMSAEGFMGEDFTTWQRCQRWVEALRLELQVMFFLKARDWPELASGQPRRRHNGRVHPWTDVHSWYVVMGGLAFEDTAPEELQFMPWGEQRVVLPAETVEWLASRRPNIIPDFSRESVEDKN